MFSVTMDLSLGLNLVFKFGCHPQVLRDQRNMEDRTLCPPWCLTVRVSGHSFQPGKEHFIPNFSLQHPKVVSLTSFIIICNHCKNTCM